MVEYGPTGPVTGPSTGNNASATEADTSGAGSPGVQTSKSGLVGSLSSQQPQIYGLNIYEDDGDSVAASILPIPLIKTVELKNIDSTVAHSVRNRNALYRDPHIDPDEPLVGFMGAGSTGFNHKYSSYDGMVDEDEFHLNIKFVFKGIVENDDLALFQIPKLTNAMKIGVLQIYNNSLLNDLMEKAGEVFPESNADVFTYVPQTIPKFMLYSPKNDYDEIFNDANRNYFDFSTYSLSEIPEFNKFIDAVNGDGTVNLSNVSSALSSLTALDFETNSNGDSVYSIPFNQKTDRVLHYNEIDDLTIFAFSYIDFKIAFSDDSMQDMEEISGGPGWGHLLPMNNTHPTPNILSVGAKQAELIEYFMDYGYSMPVMKQILKDGELYHSNKVFVYQGTEDKYKEKAGKIWYGPVHLHTNKNPAPNGYVGYMGGLATHMGVSSIETPRLDYKEVPTPEYTPEVVDLRSEGKVSKMFLNYSDYNGLDPTKFELFEAKKTTTGFTFTPPEAYDFPPGVTLSQAMLDNLRSRSIFSELFSTHNKSFVYEKDGTPMHQIGLFTSIDLFELIKRKTLFPGFLLSNNIDKVMEIYEKGYVPKVKEVQILVREVTNQQLDNNQNYLKDSKNDNEKVLAIVNPSEDNTVQASNSLPEGVFIEEYFNDIVRVSTVKDYFAHHGTDSSGDPVDRHLNLNITHMLVRNPEGGQNKKTLQYGVRLKLEDPIFNFLKTKLDQAKQYRDRLAEYDQLIRIYDDNGYNTTDIHSNVFKKDFWKAPANMYSQLSNGFMEVPTHSSNVWYMAEIFWGLETYVTDVVGELKCLTGQEEAELFNLLRYHIWVTTGSASGVSFVLRFTDQIVESLENLLSSVTSNGSIKSKLYGNETVGQKLAQYSSIPSLKNEIEVTHYFSEKVEIKPNSFFGLDHVLSGFNNFPNSLESSPTSNAASESGLRGIRSISAAALKQRLKWEEDKFEFFKTDTLDNSALTGNPTNPISLTPLDVHTHRSKYFLMGTPMLYSEGSVDKPNLNATMATKPSKMKVRLGIEILESNDIESNRTLYSNEFLEEIQEISKNPIPLIGFNKQIFPDELKEIETCKNFIPNMMGLLDSDGVSIEPSDGTYLTPKKEPEVSPFDVLPADGKALAQYWSSFRETFGPWTAEDASGFLSTLLLMRKANYMPDYDFDKIKSEYDPLLHPFQIKKFTTLNQYDKFTAENFAEMFSNLLSISNIVGIRYLVRDDDEANGTYFKLLTPKILDLFIDGAGGFGLESANKLLLRLDYEAREGDKYGYHMPSTIPSSDNFEMEIFNRYLILER